MNTQEEMSYPQPMTMVHSQQPRRGYFENYKGGCWTGLFQIVCAMLSIIAAAVPYVFSEANLVDTFQFAIFCFSGSIFFLITGILGCASFWKNTCVVISYLIFCIWSFLTGLSGVGFFGYGIYRLVIYQDFYSMEDFLWITVPTSLVLLFWVIEMVSFVITFIQCYQGLSYSSNHEPAVFQDQQTQQTFPHASS